MAKQSTTASRTGASPRPLQPNKLGSPSLLTFVQESRSELRKVTWPTREQTLNLTGAVIAMAVFMAVFLGIVDYLLNALVQPLLAH